MNGEFGGLDLAQLLQMAGGMGGGMGGDMSGLSSLLPMLQMQGKKKPWGNLVGNLGGMQQPPQFQLPPSYMNQFQGAQMMPMYGMMPQSGGLGFKLPNRPF